ncbi:MAG: ORF6N domain-containing protein [Sulfurovum sp.]|nr:ORF6N domain-containing protein [Sulfurovum sp.]NNJ44654.1 ORF6N domain-containing protein [Sulfurovum sp.]
MNELIVESEITSRILTLRGKQVMLDRDLSELYHVDTKRLNEQVKRNIDRFPDDFMFQLTENELENWKSQYATSNKEIMGLRKMPYAFTEEGIYMLATVLRSPVATQTSIAIIRTFKKLRDFSKHYNALAKQLIEIDRKHDKQYKELKKALDGLIAESEVADVVKIGFLK